MTTKRRLAIWSALLLLGAAVASGQSGRSAYSYVREVSGEVTVISPLNGSIEARRNLPISAGDEVRTDDPGRAEIALADGNVLHVGGGTSIQFVSLSGQQGSDDEVSAISLREGSVVLSALGSDEKAVPRVDTEDLTVYGNSGSRVRVNADPRHGSSVVVRAGSVEVRSPSGSYTVRAGNYLLVQGGEEPEIARGSFSRDRFDIWAADRLSITYDSPQNSSSQYVGEEYSGDVSSLEGYGNWDYNGDYSTYVWRPNVAAGWSPYSNGSWYYTPVGLSWWSWDPWGWYPFHYGNWFFDAGWNSWCWAPGYVYSPAWVYWAYTPYYVGWCPTGYYGYYQPWHHNYYHQWGYGRAGIGFAFHGNYPTRRVDLRGWNFTGANGFGTTRGRVEVVPGTRVADRLGGQLAISSRPIVVPTRTGAGVRESLRDYVRDAPRNIQRTADRETQQRLEPVLARDRELPRATVDALRDRVVVAERGRLSGPGAADIAPRGVPVLERGRGGVHKETSTRIETDAATGRTVIRGGSGGSRSSAPAEGSGRAPAPAQPRSDATQAWRSRSSAPEAGGRSADVRTGPDANVVGRENREHWRARSNTTPNTPRVPADRSNLEADRGAPRGSGSQRNEPLQREDWRSRGSSMPPARRVIEGSVPGRRPPGSGAPGSGAPYRESGRPPQAASPRDRGYGYAAPPREAPRPSAPAPQAAPPRSAPAPHAAPPRSAPAPPSHAAPPSHSAPPSGSHRPPG